MRLLSDGGLGELRLVEYHDDKIPRYAVLSHTWGADGEEVTYRDLIKGTGKDKAGYKKIEFCREQAANDGLQYFWMDTCCINKSSSAELSEAINSMFRWYRNAEKCYVYLSDVSISGYVSNVKSSPTSWKAAFRDSRWFRRGWTLQELIAPTSVEFFSREGDYLGSKRSLEQDIYEITKIATKALGGGPLTEFKVEERFAWAERRETKRQEDKAYSLLGIFNIHMPLLYGEGRQNAFARLRDEISKSIKPPAESPKTLLSPSSTVPFRRDVDFVDRGMIHDRGTLLSYIEQKCAVSASRVALVGVGGVGKSQLVIEYCHRVRKRSLNMWVFWVYASNADRIEQGYREIAERMKIPGRKDPKQNIFELVARWLRDESNGIWLLVLDNLDDDALLSTPQAAISRPQSNDSHIQLQRPLSAYLPQSQNGRIMITARNSSVAAKLVEPRDIILVDPMTVVDAVMLLKKKLDEPVDDSDLRELAGMLEYMPLAIVQAAAYIQQKGARYNVRQYIEAFQRSEKQKTSLLEYESGHLRRDPEAKNSVIITWQISFDDIQKKWPASADLLSLMSYCDRQGIPEEMLKIQLPEDEFRDSTSQRGNNGVRDDEKDQKEKIDDDAAFKASGDDMVEDAIERLRSYSFMSIGENGRLFEMHGLVQLATRKWLQMHGEDETWKAKFCRKLNAVLPTGEHKNWELCEILFPHAKSAEKQRPTEHNSVREWAQVLRKAGWYMWARGHYREAERMCEKSAGALRKVLGEDDVETSYSLGLLASTYLSQGRWTEAEKMVVQVVEMRKRLLGEEHPSTLTSMNNLAFAYRNQGRWTEAEKIEVQVMEARRRVLREEHPSTLTSMANLASTYWNQGRWTEAERMNMRVLEMRKRVLGEEHPSTLTSMNNLASTYMNQGRWAEAEKINIQVIETRRRVLGEEHPETLTSMINLASTYRNQGRWVEAEKIEVPVINTRTRLLGDEHPDTLTSMTSLASTYLSQGRWAEAEEVNMQVLETRRKVLGEEHPGTLTSMANLASTYSNEGRWTEAEKIEVQVLEARSRVLGREHPSTMTSIANLASTYRDQGRWTEAEGMEVQVMEARRKVLGREHPETLTIMHNLALTMKGQDKNMEAIKLMAECVELRNRVQGTKHPHSLSSAAALAEWRNTERSSTSWQSISNYAIGSWVPSILALQRWWSGQMSTG